MKKKFTDAFIRSLGATGKSYGFGDTEHKGLMVRVAATGTRSFGIAYRSRTTGKVAFYTIGHYPEVSLADAFRRHAGVRNAIALGQDPQAAKVETRELKKSALSYDALVAAFVAGKLRRQRTAHDRELRLYRVGRRFGWSHRDVDTITQDEATACLIKLAERGYQNARGKPVGGPVEAFATKSLLGTMWRWARRLKHVKANIFADLDVEEARKPRRRSRVLNLDEIRAVWAALDHVGDFGYSADCATALRLILTTTARPGMVTGMVRDELCDLDAPQPKPVTHGQLRDVTDGNGPLWILSHERMKRDDEDDDTEPFIVPLNAMAVDLIAQASGAGQRVLGPAKVTGKELLKPNRLAGCLRAIVARLGIPRATPHDLRRTAGTLIQSAVLPDRPKYLLEEVGWLLSHKSADKNGVTGIYGRYQHLDEKRAMSAVLGREIGRILSTGAAKERAAA